MDKKITKNISNHEFLDEELREASVDGVLEDFDTESNMKKDVSYLEKTESAISDSARNTEESPDNDVEQAKVEMNKAVSELTQLGEKLRSSEKYKGEKYKESEEFKEASKKVEEKREVFNKLRKEETLEVKGSDEDVKGPEEEAKNEVERVKSMDKKERKTFLEGMTNIGYRTTMIKSSVLAGFCNKLSEAAGGGTGKFFKKYAEIHEKTGKRAKDEVETVGKGVLKKGIGMGQGIGNLLKYGRVIYDFSGASRLLNPFRHVTAAAMFAGRTSEALKETRLDNREVKNKTRIEDQDEAMSEAWSLYEQAKNEEGEVTVDSLNKKYREGLPQDIINRIERMDFVGSRFMEKILSKDAKKIAEQFLKKIDKINNNKKLSPEKQQEKIDSLYARKADMLNDLDRMVGDQTGVDVVAYNSRLIEQTGKGVATAMMIDSVYRMASIIIESDIITSINADGANSIISSTKESVRDFVSRLLGSATIESIPDDSDNNTAPEAYVASPPEKTSVYLLNDDTLRDFIKDLKLSRGEKVSMLASIKSFNEAYNQTIADIKSVLNSANDSDKMAKVNESIAKLFNAEKAIEVKYRADIFKLPEWLEKLKEGALDDDDNFKANYRYNELICDNVTEECVSRDVIEIGIGNIVSNDEMTKIAEKDDVPVGGTAESSVGNPVNGQSFDDTNAMSMMTEEQLKEVQEGVRGKNNAISSTSSGNKVNEVIDKIASFYKSGVEVEDSFKTEPAVDKAPIFHSFDEGVKEHMDSVTAPEDAPSSAVGKGSYVTKSFNIADSVKIKQGDSVWKVIGEYLRNDESFNNLSEGEKNYQIDAIKDRIVAEPQKYGLSKSVHSVEDFKKLTVDDLRRVDCKKAFMNEGKGEPIILDSHAKQVPAESVEKSNFFDSRDNFGDLDGGGQYSTDKIEGSDMEIAYLDSNGDGRIDNIGICSLDEKEPIHFFGKVDDDNSVDSLVSKAKEFITARENSIGQYVNQNITKNIMEKSGIDIWKMEELNSGSDGEKLAFLQEHSSSLDKAADSIALCGDEDVSYEDVFENYDQINSLKVDDVITPDKVKAVLNLLKGDANKESLGKIFGIKLTDESYSLKGGIHRIKGFNSKDFDLIIKVTDGKIRFGVDGPSRFNWKTDGGWFKKLMPTAELSSENIGIAKSKIAEWMVSMKKGPDLG